MFTKLEGINSRPEPFQYYTAEELWTDKLPALRYAKKNIYFSLKNEC